MGWRRRILAQPETDRYTDNTEVSMPTHTSRFPGLQLACFVVLALMSAGAQENPIRQNREQQNVQQNKDGPTPPAGTNYSGMYSFLREGEFVQVTVEEQGRVTGFVSRYGDTESDRGAFLDHFFKSGKLDGDRLAFTTEAVHGISFEFRGTVERGSGKTLGDEAYYLLQGSLIENSTDEAKKPSSRTMDVVLRSFPRDLGNSKSEKK